LCLPHVFWFLKKSVLKLLDRTVYFVNDFGMVPVASIITGTVSVLFLHSTRAVLLL
jgi:hypothetical protein